MWSLQELKKYIEVHVASSTSQTLTEAECYHHWMRQSDDERDFIHYAFSDNPLLREAAEKRLKELG